ncbi:MAG: D-aminoacylase [Betaproteobacteria bacterium]|nr:D-aminoacylase [Betaproteobacteria bacterium]
MHDLVVRGALIVDGTGRAGFHGDVAVDNGVLVQVGGKAGAAKRDIAAEGAIVTPGFVDVHTHYDAQVRWDPYLSPSSWHGVTSVVFGNCGVGFAPAKPAARDWLIGLMESIEDIPSATLRAGIRWGWESFPEFLDALEQTELAIDVGAQIPHAAVRTYVMGERGAANERASEADMRAMTTLVREAMAAGALGFTGSRSVNHRNIDGRNAPGYGVDTDEVTALARAAGEAGRGGCIGFIVDFEDVEREIAWLRGVRRASGMSVWCLLTQSYEHPDKWARILELMAKASAEGEPLHAQVPGRSVSNMLGLTSSRNPFFLNPSFREIAALPLEGQVAKLRDPAFRTRLLSEKPDATTETLRNVTGRFERMFRLGDPPDYEPSLQGSVGELARAQGRSPQDVVLDIMLEREGNELLFMPLTNYADGNLDSTLKMLRHPNAVLGLSDGGAHVSRVCDSSTPTYMLTHWARDRKRGPTLPLEEAVRMQTSSTASFFGINDRGVLAQGRKADLNVIDFAGLALRAPEMVRDLPGNAKRLVQKADGYLATVVSGVPIFENGNATGAMPGRLIRGSRKK